MTADEVVLVMNYVHGTNLAQILFGKSKYRDVSPAVYLLVNTPVMFTLIQLTESDVHFSACKLTDALQYMHHHEPVVIHQDIKPQNVLVRI